MLFTTSLNSGSNGNCYYIGNDKEAILIDAGLSCRETEKRMRLLGLSMNIVKAIFVSHEHSDHIKGIQVLAEKYDLPVHISKATCMHSGIKLKKQLFEYFTTDKPVQVGQLSITAFAKFHDAADPHSFLITSNGIRIGVFTDIGSCCERLVKHFSQCHAAYLEANYDEVLLENGRYPIHLKNRIRGGNGHLSNKQALEIFTTHRPPFMTHLFLSHLSRDNNSPELVQQLFNKHAGKTTIVVASRYEPTSIYKIVAPVGRQLKQAKPITSLRPQQLSMF